MIDITEVKRVTTKIKTEFDQLTDENLRMKIDGKVETLSSADLQNAEMSSEVINGYQRVMKKRMGPLVEELTSLLEE